MTDTTLTPEHAAQRLGRVTASRIADVVAMTKTGWGASRQNYRAELIAERLTGMQAARFVNKEMLHGIETEPYARDAYEFRFDCDVQPGGFWLHPLYDMAGASPDGLIGADGLVEFKCPSTATHLDTLLGQPFDKRYVDQCQWQMACTGRAWCDLASFDPRLPESMRLFVKRIVRDEKRIAELEQAVKVFLGEIETIVAELKGKYEEAA